MKQCKHIFHIFGLKRNGNHPIIYWLLENIKVFFPKTVFLNDINHKDVQDGKIDKMILENDIILISYEEIAVSDIDKVKYFPKIQVDETIMIVLRDVGNSLSSRIEYISKFHSETINVMDYFIDNQLYIDMWIGYAEKFLDHTNTKYRCINFNSWFISRYYRDMVFFTITGLNSNDLAVNHVPRHGNGSSFDSMDYDGRASQMDVLYRWKGYVDKEEFKTLILQNYRLLTLNKKIFNIDYNND